MQPLPVDRALPQLLAMLRDRGAAVLVAPTGSGKSTRAAPALLDLVEPEQAVLLLQPRRVAARMLARRIAHERGGAVGEEVGFRVRFEARVSKQTRLEVLTEGLLARRLQDDPFLEGEGGWGRSVGAVVLDELHERSLHTDLALALLGEVRQAREDLKLVAMSATLDPGPVAELLDAGVILAEGRTFPVEIAHQGPDLQPADLSYRGGGIERVAAAVRQLLGELPQGDVLVFMPGASEIDRVVGALSDLPRSVAVLPLHGRLTAREQDRALAEAASLGVERKVVIATNIAETSLTLPGVRGVVDSGLARQPVLDPASGIEQLHTVLISRASADQRAGRAGRVATGRCLRLWTEFQHGRRDAANTPEICRLDLRDLVLQVHGWTASPETLHWLDPAPDAAWSTAVDNLTALGALDVDGITGLGRRLQSLPAEPRLGRVLLAAQETGQAGAAAALVALVTERDAWSRHRDLGVEDRLEAILGGPDRGADRQALDRMRRVARQLAGAVGARLQGAVDLHALLPALLAGLPGRLGRLRQEGERPVKLASGRGAELAPWLPLPRSPWLVALDIHSRPRGADRIGLAVELSEEEVMALPRRTVRLQHWDEDRGAVVAAEEERIGELVLVRREVQARPEEAALALAEAAYEEPQRHLELSQETEQLVFRVCWLRQQRPDLELPPWESLDDALRRLLPRLCRGRRKLSELAKADAAGALYGALDWQARQALERLAPASWTLPTGASRALDYDPEARQGSGPVLRVRVQRLFGLTRHPCVLDGQVPLTLQLLAPNQRPLQVTSDLPGFWAGSWTEVRKDMRGRYPKHSWPQDPVAARAEDRPRRRR